MLLFGYSLWNLSIVNRQSVFLWSEISIHIYSDCPLFPHFDRFLFLFSWCTGHVFNIVFVSLLYKTHCRFHVSLRLFGDQSHKTWKCGQNISDTLGYHRHCYTTFWCHRWSITQQTRGSFDNNLLNAFSVDCRDGESWCKSFGETERHTLSGTLTFLRPNKIYRCFSHEGSSGRLLSNGVSQLRSVKRNCRPIPFAFVSLWSLLPSSFGQISLKKCR